MSTTVLLGLLLLGPMSALAQEESDEPELGWTNEMDLSLVVTEGNSSTETFGFKNLLRRNWKLARYTFRIDAVRSNTADDSIAVVDEDDLENYEIVTFDKTVDVENYLVENRYDRTITERFFWNVGLTWDRNKDAGILSRWIGFAGVGNIWWDRDDFKFNTSYGFSYTKREEEDGDPDKDETFPGFRFNWEYQNQWGKVTTFNNDWVINYNFSDSEDWNFDMISAITMDINSRLAFRVSLRWLYNNLPALQDIDVFLEDGNGNPFGLPIVVQEPKEKLDTIFRTSLVIKL